MGFISSPVKTGSKTHRTVEVLRHFDCGYTLVEVCERGPRSLTISLYYVTPIEADFGVAFEWRGLAEKAGSVYCCNIGGDEGHPSCDCMGFAKGGYCRHVKSSQQLVEGGAIAPYCRKAKPVCKHEYVFTSQEGERACADCCDAV